MTKKNVTDVEVVCVDAAEQQPAEAQSCEKTEEAMMPASEAEIFEGMGMLIGTAQYYMGKLAQGAFRAANNLRARELGITPEELLAIESPKPKPKPKSKRSGSRKDMKRIQATSAACEQINREIAEGKHLDAQGKIVKESVDPSKTTTYKNCVALALGENPHIETLDHYWKKVPRKYKRDGRPDDQ